MPNNKKVSFSEAIEVYTLPEPHYPNREQQDINLALINTYYDDLDTLPLAASPKYLSTSMPFAIGDIISTFNDFIIAEIRDDFIERVKGFIIQNLTARNYSDIEVDHKFNKILAILTDNTYNWFEIILMRTKETHPTIRATMCAELAKHYWSEEFIHDYTQQLNHALVISNLSKEGLKSILLAEQKLDLYTDACLEEGFTKFEKPQPAANCFHKLNRFLTTHPQPQEEQAITQTSNTYVPMQATVLNIAPFNSPAPEASNPTSSLTLEPPRLA